MLDLDMGRYALFVWPAWGVSALVLTGLIVRALIASRRWKRELAQREEADGATKPAQVAQRAAGQEK